MSGYRMEIDSHGQRYYLDDIEVDAEAFKADLMARGVWLDADPQRVEIRQYAPPGTVTL